MFYRGNTISFVWGHSDLYKNEYNDHYLLVVPLIKLNDKIIFTGIEVYFLIFVFISQTFFLQLLIILTIDRQTL